MHFVVDICQQWWREAPEASHSLMHLRNVKLLFMTICIHFVKKKRVEDKDLVSHPVGVTSADFFTFFFTKADKLLHQRSRIHGAKGETWVCRLPGPERSGDRVRHRSHRDASEFHNNSCAAARLLCQRVASQAGKTGACKLSEVEL